MKCNIIILGLIKRKKLCKLQLYCKKIIIVIIIIVHHNAHNAQGFFICHIINYTGYNQK